MNLSERDKKALTVGAGLVVLVLLLGYVIMPGIRSWSETRGELSSRREQLSNLRERVESHGALVKQRNALVMRLGALFDPAAAPAVPVEKKGKDAPAPGKESKEDSVETKAEPTQPDAPKPEGESKEPTAVPAPEAKAEAPPSPTPESPKSESPAAEPGKEATAKPEEAKLEEGAKEGSGEKPREGATLAGFVEQSAQKAGVTIKSITPAVSTLGRRGGKSFRPVSLQVKCDCNVQGLVGLLQALEKGERFVKIEQVQINRDASKDTMSVTMDVRAYESTARAS